MRRYDILALGELNADLLLNRIHGLPEVGKEKFADKMDLVMGSSTAIFAANASVLGAKVAFMGMIGKDAFGTVVKDSLRTKGVYVDHLIERRDIGTGLTVVMNYDNDRANVTYPGAMSDMGYGHIDFSVVKQSRHVHISSIFLQQNLLKDLYRIVTHIKECGATVSIDTQWDPTEEWLFDWKRILPLTDVFMPNEKELMCLTGKNSVESAVDMLSPYSHNIVVKMGTAGSLLVQESGKRSVLPAFLNSEVVDAIGAGDSFNAGFVSAFVKGLPLAECQRVGNLMGAVNTTAAGGTGAFTSKEAVVRVAMERFSQELILR